MKKSSYLLLASALLGVTGVASAATNPWFVGADYGWNKQNINGVYDQKDEDHQYSLKAGKYLGNSDQHRITLSYNNGDGDVQHHNYDNDNYLLSYDYMLPVAYNTNVFAGASAGVSHTKITGVDNDFVYGFQAGAQYNFTQAFGAELGYRWLDQDYDKDHAKLDDTQQAYVGVEYRFY